MICRMRSIKDTAKFFKEMDPDTQLTEHTIRSLIANGTIPVISTGKKSLVNIDLLLNMFGSSGNNLSKLNTNFTDINPVINK